MVSYDNNPSDAALVVFNTLVPQNHLNNVRRFMLPPKYLGRGVQMYLGPDRSLGTMVGGDRLIADPSQAVLVMSLSPGARIFLILRTQPLIEHACSTRVGVQIPWDEWGGDMVVMKVPGGYSYSATFVHGARVLVIRNPLDIPQGHYRIHMFDFSRWGSAALLLSDGRDGGAERMVVFEDGQSSVFEMGDWANQPYFVALGDSVMFYIASPLSYSIK